MRLLLVRANEQRAGARIPRPRALAVVPIMPLDIASAASFSSWTADLHDYWMYRLGNMVLMQGKEGRSTGSRSTGAVATACCCVPTPAVSR